MPSAKILTGVEDGKRKRGQRERHLRQKVISSSRFKDRFSCLDDPEALCLTPHSENSQKECLAVTLRVK